MRVRRSTCKGDRKGKARSGVRLARAGEGYIGDQPSRRYACVSIRAPAVAGTFYPDDASALESSVRQLLGAQDGATGVLPKALIVPHAGYVYSGPVAAAAYRLLRPMRTHIRRVVLIGPAHRVYLHGMALPSVDAFATPLGTVWLDRASIDRLLELPHTTIADDAHLLEHCLEVQLPFLQAVLDEFRLVPIVVGSAAAEDVAAVIEAVWGGDETLILVSSDLSHYFPYDAARARDADTSAAICARSTELTPEQACGAFVINGMMVAARAHGLEVEALDVRNSGDTAGDRYRVVGYGAYALF